MTFKQIFKDSRIVGLCGNKDSGKTNNLISLVNTLNKSIKCYFYGIDSKVKHYLIKKGHTEISSLNHLANKRDCVLILDEFQKLKLNDRRYKDLLQAVINFAYHNNVYIVFCSPAVREFNSVIGSYIEKWLIKSINLDDCINGSQLKKAILDYKGEYKSDLGFIDIPKNKLLVLNNECEVVLNCDYVKDIDNKASLKKLF